MPRKSKDPTQWVEEVIRALSLNFILQSLGRPGPWWSVTGPGDVGRTLTFILRE